MQCHMNVSIPLLPLPHTPTRFESRQMEIHFISFHFRPLLFIFRTTPPRCYLNVLEDSSFVREQGHRWILFGWNPPKPRARLLKVCHVICFFFGNVCQWDPCVAALS